MVANNSLVRPAGYFLGEKTVAHDFFAPLGRLVQVGFHRADCLHQLILANLKLGHYSKAKAIGLQRIWWLVVGGFWGLTLFFLGVLAGSFFFPGELVLLLGFARRKWGRPEMRSERLWGQMKG